MASITDTLFRQMKEMKKKEETEKISSQKIMEQKEARELATLKILAEDNLKRMMQESENFKSFVDRFWIHEDQRGNGIMWQACDGIVLASICWDNNMEASGAHFLLFVKHDYSLDIWEQQSGNYSDFLRPIRDRETRWGQESLSWREFKDTLEKLTQPKTAIEFFLTLKPRKNFG